MRNKLTKQNLEHENEKLNWKQEKKKHKLGKQTRNWELELRKEKHSTVTVWHDSRQRENTGLKYTGE